MRTLAALLAVGALGLGGCTGSDDRSPAPALSPTASEELVQEDGELTDEAERLIEDEIVLDGKDSYPGASAVSDREFVAFGREICERMSTGGGGIDEVAVWTAEAWRARFGVVLPLPDAAELTGTAIGAMCGDQLGLQ